MYSHIRLFASYLVPSTKGRTQSRPTLTCCIHVVCYSSSSLDLEWFWSQLSLNLKGSHVFLGILPKCSEPVSSSDWDNSPLWKYETKLCMLGHYEKYNKCCTRQLYLSHLLHSCCCTCNTPREEKQRASSLWFKKDLGLTFLFILCFSPWMYVFESCVVLVPTEVRRGVKSSGRELDGCEPLCCFWKLNLGSLLVNFLKVICLFAFPEKLSFFIFIVNTPK